VADLGIANIGDATLIASGGSALVYRATGADGTEVAVKVLRGMRGAEVRRRFEREQSAAELLTGHPRIIEILESGVTESGEPYLIMPLIAGGSLQEELEARGAFPHGQAIADVRTAAEAIQFAHSKGVLHRDIKPGNLLRAADGTVIVTDFGIARVKDAGITSATIGATTPLFAAPELLAENQASPQSDVYALGALLYALLAGKPAFSTSSNLWASLNLVRTQMPEPIDGVKPAVMRVIEQAMAKNPAHRPPTAALFSDYLGQALDADDSWRPPRPADVTQPIQFPPAGGVQHPQQVPAVSATPIRNVKPVLPIDRGSTSLDRPAQRPQSPSRGQLLRADDRGRGGTGGRWLMAAAAIVLLAGAAWWGVGRLNPDTTEVVGLPIDNSIPSPTSTVPPVETNDSPVPVDDTVIPDPTAAEPTVTPAPIPTADPDLGTVSGEFFTASIPDNWRLDAKDKDVIYGYRTTYRSGDSYIHIDTTPVERQTTSIPIEQSAREIAATISSASPVTEDRFGDRSLWSFTFVNNQGTPAIDIFFEDDGDGYAVTAGSVSDPQGAFALAQQVALSIQSTP